jgi:hypothetical protein
MWSDNQKRIFCRLAFLLLCAVPTGVTVYRILHPQTADQWEQRIQAQLGVRTHIDSVETPGPYETILRGVVFFDAEQKQKILIATELRIRFGEVNQIWIDHPVRLDSNGLQYILDQANQQLVRSHSVQPRWVVMVNSAVVESSVVMDDHFGTLQPRELGLKNLVIDIESNASDTIARTDFQLVDPNAAVPAGNPNVISCSIQRERVPTVPGVNSPEQWVTLNTGSDALPCWLVSEWLPEIIQNLGTEVAFSGGIQIETGSPDLHGQAEGRFFKVDMQQVTGKQLANNDSTRWSSIELEQFKFAGKDVQHIAFLSTPGSRTPSVRIEKTLEVSETFDIGLDIRNAALQQYRQATENIIRRRVTYPASETRLVVQPF